MLGDKISNLRKKKSLTQKQLANELGIAQSTIGMIEKNERGASRDLLIKFAKYFDVSLDYLLSTDEQLEVALDSINKIKSLAKEGLNFNSNESNSIKETSESYLSKKDERDIGKALSKTLDQLEHSQDGLMFDGEPIDDETRELLRISLENSMRLAKQIAKSKFTPKKYKK